MAFRAWLQGGHGPARRQQLQRGFRCWECWARARLHHLAIVRWQFERLSGQGPGGTLAAPGASPRRAGVVPYDAWTKQVRPPRPRGAAWRGRARTKRGGRVAETDAAELRDRYRCCVLQSPPRHRLVRALTPAPTCTGTPRVV